MFPFYTPKITRKLKFSDVFRGYRKGEMARNELKPKLLLKINHKRFRFSKNKPPIYYYWKQPRRLLSNMSLNQQAPRKLPCPENCPTLYIHIIYICIHIYGVIYIYIYIYIYILIDIYIYMDIYVCVCIYINIYIYIICIHVYIYTYIYIYIYIYIY